MNCLEEVKQFYASTSKEYLDYIRNCERKGKQIDVCCILIEYTNFSPKSYNIVVRTKTQEKNIEKECRFSSLNVSVDTSIFEMLTKQFQL